MEILNIYGQLVISCLIHPASRLPSMFSEMLYCLYLSSLWFLMIYNSKNHDNQIKINLSSLNVFRFALVDETKQLINCKKINWFITFKEYYKKYKFFVFFRCNSTWRRRPIIPRRSARKHSSGSDNGAVAAAEDSAASTTSPAGGAIVRDYWGQSRVPCCAASSHTRRGRILSIIRVLGLPINFLSFEISCALQPVVIS